MLTLSNIDITINDKNLVRNFGITIFAGGLLLIRGHNGSGKTSLLRIIAGLAKPAGGNIYWNNININDDIYTYYSLLAYQGHKLGLNYDLSVYQNLHFFTKLNDSSLMLSAAISYFQLGNYLDVKVKKLSEGYIQRVKLAALMATNSRLWILDEPTNNLDKNGLQLLYNVITSKCEQGGIVIMASHDDIPIKEYMTINLPDYADKDL